MARDDERDGLEHTGYRSGRVRIVGAEPAGRSAAMRAEEEAPTSWEDADDDGDVAASDSVVPPLPHWTEPATGEVPAVLSRQPDEGADPFASLPGPTWREEGADWEAQDEDFEPSMLAGDRTGQGSLDTGPSDRQPWVFDLPGSGSSARRIFGDAQEWDDDDSAWEDLTKNVPAPSWVSEGDDEGPITAVIPVVGGEQEDPFDAVVPAASPPPLDEPVPDERVVIDDIDDPIAEPRSRFRSLRSERRQPGPVVPERRSPASHRGSPAERLRPPPGHRPDEAPPRNVALAIASGVVLGALALICFKVGPVASVALVTVVITMAAAEGFAAFRQGGYHPVTLLGLVATVSLSVAAYNKGEAALPLVFVLLIAFCFIWHLAGVESTDTVRSIGTTLFVFGWVAVFGSFASLLVSPSMFADRHGIAFLLGGIIAVVAYDVGALTFGAWLGRHPLASVSPNKTWEGFVGGLLTCVVITTVVVHLIHPWTVGKAAALGLVISIVATVGDLFESTVKRHLGRKDMGRLMPGHGGLLDRIDGLLFALPATFYLVIAFHMG
jgi:phosphatidate cytidylyltransferase